MVKQWSMNELIHTERKNGKLSKMPGFLFQKIWNKMSTSQFHGLNLLMSQAAFSWATTS